MGNYFPEDIVVEDVQSPTEILADAKKDWEVSTKGVLTLLFQKTKSESGNDMIIIHAQHIPNNRTGRLFSVVHRPSVSYPVTIIPEIEEDLPDVLKKTYFKSNSLKAIGATVKRFAVESEPVPVLVTNEWVAGTPSEFRTKLQQALKLGSVKALILNLAAGKRTNDSVDETLVDQ